MGDKRQMALRVWIGIGSALFGFGWCPGAFAGVYTTLTGPNANSGSTYAYGVNNLDAVVGYYYYYQTSTDFRLHGYIYSNGVFTTLDNPAAAPGHTFPNGINDSGTVVGGYETTSDRYGFIYSNGIFTQLSDPNATIATYATGINNSGTVVGYYYNSPDLGDPHGASSHGFIYSNGTYTTLDAPNSVAGTTIATGINNSGQVVGYFEGLSAQYNGFIYDNGVYSSFINPDSGSAPNPRGTYAWGINDSGNVVGYYTDSQSRAHPFLYNGGTFTALSLSPADAIPGSDLLYAINDLGDTVGNYAMYGSGTHGFVLVPEPSTLVLGLLGFAAVGLAAPRKRR